jgi:threonyl-tRNA synthetase
LRLLIFHVDAFACTVTQKGRATLVETPAAPTTRIEDGLLVLAAVESGDERSSSEVQRGTVEEIQKLASQLKVNQVMLLPFAHLFAEPAPPGDAVALIDGVADELRAGGFTVERPPFGWFHTWDLQAKGHPLSRVARTIRADVAGETARETSGSGA